MYLNFSVLIDSIPRTVVLLKKAKSTYVQLELGRTYDSKKKYNVAKRTIIGKVCPDDEKRMFPNERFLKEFPEYAVPEEREEAKRSCCLKIGAYLVIKKVIQEYGLDAFLERQLGDNAGLFVDLLSYMIVNEDNAGQYYPDYAFTHPLFTKGMRILSDSTVSRFFNRISKDNILGFLNEWNGKQDHHSRIYISYDSTNKNSQAGDINLLEFGNAKENKDTPIFNLSIAFDKTNRTPLFYEEYPGSINDVSQLRYLVDKVKDYNYKNVGFILDRGYFSADNLRYMDENKYPFVMMLKGNKPLVASIVLEKKGTFEESRDCRINGTSLYAITSQKSFAFETKKRYFHLYFNPTRAAVEREQFEGQLDKMATLLEKHYGEEITLEHSPLKDYYEFLFDKKKFIGFTEKKDAIEERLRLCGYFAIVTSEKMTASEAYFLYKGRDPSEKLFRADKSFLGSKSMRVHTETALSSKVWLGFVALIVRNRIYNLLKDEMLRLPVRKNYMTVPAAIKELEKIEMVRRSGNLYRLDHAVTKTQLSILNAFGIGKDDVLAEAATIAAALEKTTNEKGEDDAAREELEDAGL